MGCQPKSAFVKKKVFCVQNELKYSVGENMSNLNNILIKNIFSLKKNHLIFKK